MRPIPVTIRPRRKAVYVTGSTYTGRTRQDITTIGYNATTGAPLWVKTFGGDHKDDIPASLAVSQNGASVIVAASSAASPTPARSHSFLVLAYGAVSGTKLWSTRLLQDSGPDDAAAAVVVSPNDRTVFATGHKKFVMTTEAIRL